MPKRTLLDHRPWLLLALIAAVARYFLMDADLPETRLVDFALIAIKGSAVAFLAVYALVRHDSTDARLLTAVLALGALGDVAIEFSMVWGGAAFFTAHGFAVVLYLSNRQPNPASSRVAAAAALLIFTPLICWLLTPQLLPTLYGAALGAMAACAWLSRFPRYRVGLGAVLFVLSDWLIVAEMDMFYENPWPARLIWPLYFIGQFLIATGVIQTLRSEVETRPT